MLVPAEGLIEIQSAVAPDRVGIGKGRIPVSAADQHGGQGSVAQALIVILNVAPCENISYGACRDGGCNRGAGAPGEAELAFYCGTCGGALNVNARGSNIRFYPSERSVSSAAVDVYAVVAVVVGCNRKGHGGISRIHGGVVGIRAQKDGLIRYKAMHRQPCMELSGDVQGRVDTDSPDSGGRGFKADKDQLSSGAAFKILITDCQHRRV